VRFNSGTAEPPALVDEAEAEGVREDGVVELGLGFEDPKRRRDPRSLLGAGGVGEVKGREEGGREEVMVAGSIEEEDEEVEV